MFSRRVWSIFKGCHLNINLQLLNPSVLTVIEPCKFVHISLNVSITVLYMIRGPL